MIKDFFEVTICDLKGGGIHGKKEQTTDIIPVVAETIDIKSLIYVIRGQQVMLDSDLAMLYQVETKAFNQAVSRNIERFPENFRFQLTKEEFDALRSQIATSNGRGGRRYRPYMFTEQGIAMLSGVLRSDVAVQASIRIMNTFVEMRRFIANNALLFEKVSDIELKQLEYQKSTDERFDKVFQYIEDHAESEQKIFFDGQIYDAFSLITSIIQKAQNEIILPILQDGIDTQNYGGSLFLIASTFKDDMGDHGTSESWAGNRARKQLVEKFFPNSEPPTGLDVAGMVNAAGDDRAMFFSVDRNLSVEETSVYTDGFSVAKFTNSYSNGANPRDSKFVDMDVPFMRAAEAYLTYAEAQTRLGNTDEAKPAIDALKDRAHATSSKQGVYSLDDILDEWAREFWFEGRRRMDLVRFGRFGGQSEYLWEFMNGIPTGGSFSSNFNVFGIPTTDLDANPNLQGHQNPGY